MLFEIISDKVPSGDQPNSIEFLIKNSDQKNQLLLGVTGSGKTYTIAKVIEKLQKPTLIISPNKTLAAQFYYEMKELFPNNSVEYFVSYYDYYQPESYIARTDTYIEKEATINEKIDRMRHSATRALFERKDVIIVASVSCIYGVGLPDFYHDSRKIISVGDKISINELSKYLVGINYKRNDISINRGTFRVNGDTFYVFPSHTDDICWKISFFGNDVEKIEELNAKTGKVICKNDTITIYPNSHYLADTKELKRIVQQIKLELKERLSFFKENNRFIEEQRVRERVLYDIEMLEQTGTCKGIENYSRYLTGRMPGEPPPTLFEYMPKDSLLVVDESHVSIPQIRAMYNGDRARKTNLAEYGFRLPSCVDNRPLKFEEWDNIRPNTIFVSATPGDYEINLSNGFITEQIIRPTGIVDPEIIIKPAKNQVDILLDYINQYIKLEQRVMVVTLTKKMAEYLSEYLVENGIKAKYLHSDIETLERVEIIKELRSGVFDVLIGINMLREGMDIPECGLVAILDADKEGFLRSGTSLIQTIGRAARNKDGVVVLFADQITDSMKYAINETNRRRKIQQDYNNKHNIIPKSIISTVKSFNFDKMEKTIPELEEEMKMFAENLDFENAAKIRDKIKMIKKNKFIK